MRIIKAAITGCAAVVLVLVGTSAASADVGVTTGEDSILGGNQVIAPISAPIDVCGNAVAVLGNAPSGCAISVSG
ncbi:chaplin family protein [Streptomyces sp. NPDC053048]|uniref:chaplin family protein n=1 Tax=Streptomyces sp. NPDC053048 TaxID=3365694 RepID=UPI0037D3B95E